MPCPVLTDETKRGREARGIPSASSSLSALIAPKNGVEGIELSADSLITVHLRQRSLDAEALDPMVAGCAVHRASQFE
jgi:hypothetical protein